MKTRFLTLIILLIAIIFSTGCATALRGTHREMRTVSNIPNTKFTLVRQGADGVQEKVGQNRTFDLTTPNRQPFTVTAQTPGGQRDAKTVEWTPAGWVSMAGGGLGFGLVFGVGGLASVGVDALTGAYSQPKTNEVVFWFDPSREVMSVKTQLPSTVIKPRAPIIRQQPQVVVQSPPPTVLVIPQVPPLPDKGPWKTPTGKNTILYSPWK